MQQTFTSNWPKNLWLAVDQRGVHLLEARTRNVLTTYEYEGLIDYTPSLNHMLIITGTDKKQSKIIVNTNQVSLYCLELKLKIKTNLNFLSGVPDVQLDQRVHGEDRGDSREAAGDVGQWK